VKGRIILKEVMEGSVGMEIIEIDLEEIEETQVRDVEMMDLGEIEDSEGIQIIIIVPEEALIEGKDLMEIDLIVPDYLSRTYLRQ
jgi:hypothetical protein